MHEHQDRLDDALEQRIRDVEARIEAACVRSGRSRSGVNVVAVTKYVTAETAESVLDRGYTHIGENRWQDAKAKWERFGDRGIWHFIGHLQTNKVKDVVGKFAYVHSLDRLSLAQELNKKAAALGIAVPCFVQVNISGEDTKYGLPPEHALDFVQSIRGMNGIEPIGWMTMAPYEAEPEATRPVFRRLRELRDEANRLTLTDKPMLDLSMGMSNDFEVAIEEGATWIRLGSVLVGKEL